MWDNDVQSFYHFLVDLAGWNSEPDIYNRYDCTHIYLRVICNVHQQNFHVVKFLFNNTAERLTLLIFICDVSELNLANVIF